VTAYTAHHTLTPVRMAALRRVLGNPRYRLVANLRDWLIREGYIRAAEPKPGPRPCGPNHSYRLPGQAHEVTPRGLAAVAVADAQKIPAESAVP
jgi:hypothetical protein